MKARIIFHVGAILVLIAAVAAAQSPEKKEKPANPEKPEALGLSELFFASESDCGLSQHDDSVAGEVALGRKPRGIFALDRGSAGPPMPEAGFSSSVKPRQRPHADLQAIDAQRNLTHDTELRQQP